MATKMTDKAMAATEKVAALLQEGKLAGVVARAARVPKDWDLPGARWSLANRVLAISTTPSLERMVGDFRAFGQWGDAGRQVAKGRNAVIFRPWFYRWKEEDEDGNEVPRQRLGGFRLLAVWDASETTGDPLPYDDLPQQAIDATGLAPLVEAWALNVSPDVLGTVLGTRSLGHTNGQGDIALKDSASAAQVLLHEVVHEADIRALDLSPADFRDRYANEPGFRPAAELVAETGALALAQALGLEMPSWTGAASEAYLTYWGGGDRAETARAVYALLDRVTKAVSLVLEALEGAAEPAPSS